MKLRQDFINIVGIFLVWRIYLIIIFIIAINYVPLGYKDKFLGGGPENYAIVPQIFAWANFDGEHYLSIAIFGYKGLEQAFFPVYPQIIGLIVKSIHLNFSYPALLLTTAIVGITLSNLFLLLSLVILWDLVRIDFSSKVAYLTIVLLLVFPTSFYFASLYNESLFLLLAVSSFYAARKGHWWLAGLLGGVSSATRIFGILLLPALVLQIFHSKTDLKQIKWLLMIPSGLLAYMVYLWFTVNDPIAFFHLQAIVGEQRTSGFTSLPRTFARYYNMLVSVSVYNPIYQTLILEVISGALFLILPVYGYIKKKIALSYLFFALTGFLVASAQGSLSSVPRYVLVLFPSFIIFALFVNDLPKIIQYLVILFSSIFLFLETTLFLRGYWVA